MKIIDGKFYFGKIWIDLILEFEDGSPARRYTDYVAMCDDIKALKARGVKVKAHIGRCMLHASDTVNHDASTKFYNEVTAYFDKQFPKQAA